MILTEKSSSMLIIMSSLSNVRPELIVILTEKSSSMLIIMSSLRLVVVLVDYCKFKGMNQNF